MVIIGLSGGIATGKNLISNYLKKKGIKVFDADSEVHKLFSNDHTNIYTKIIGLFPECIEHGKINRRILGKIVFQNPQKLQQLENIIYPELTKKLEGFIRDNKDISEKIIVINAPTLYKAGWDKKCDYVIFLHSDTETQKKRYFTRSDAEFQSFKNIKKNQEKEEEKGKQIANFLVDTSKDEHLVMEEIDTIINDISKNEK